MAQSASTSGRPEREGDLHQVPATVHNRGAVATVIYLMLRAAERPLRVHEIAEASGRPPSTIRHHTREMATDGVLEQRPDHRDARRSVFALPPSLGSGGRN